ncbi:MAG: cation-transporting P-type ATPase [Myxococcales bacterium]|nr:cation-transporting P-type ATPase [Myxococcales bacterium]MCB9580638.1 cation-transporting P-type ATPase [Polyangiaceae bacterium]
MAPPWASEIAEIERRFAVDSALGLSVSDATERRQRDGDNVLEEAAPPSPVRQFLEQFTDITVIALLVAAALAVALAWSEPEKQTFLGRFGDAIAIGIIVLMNAAIGFVQERKAERALRALRRLGAPEATVLRAGERVRVPAAEVARGDVVLVSEGDRVPADARLVAAEDLVVTEAALTGESQPVQKETTRLDAETALAERANMLFMGTHVGRGVGRAVVVHTGMRTELGSIATLLGQVRSPDTPLQKSLRRFGTWVVVGCALVGAVVFAVGLVRLEAPIGFLLLTAVSLAVAAIPEGLPAITTIVLALGVQRMAKKNALVRRLAAVETLGSATVICTDKTGTLTQNRMTVRRMLAGSRELTVELGADEQTLVFERGDEEPASFLPHHPFGELVLGCGFSPAAREIENERGESEIRGDPTDAALLSLHSALASRADKKRESYPVERVVPFDRERKMTTVVARGEDALFAFAHGAPESILERAETVLHDDGELRPLGDAERERVHRTVEDWAADGLRVLAVARSVVPADDPPPSSRRVDVIARFERDMTLLGLVGLADPPRPEVPRALRRAARAGVKTVMITGDHPRTAEAIAREIGMLSDLSDDERSRSVLTGRELEALSEAERRARVRDLRVLARATAQDKLELVQALKAAGEVVAMTGDGVNDAPAIKAASIGVAMGQGGTDVTREAADMVLLDDNYATIVSAIEEGRIVYGNIKRFIVFLFAVNTGLVLSVLVAALLGWQPILTPTQILWINLITNGLPALALGMEPATGDPMREAPRDSEAALVSAGELRWLLGYGTLMGVLGLLVFEGYRLSYVHLAGGELAVARTATFTLLAVAPLFHALSSRSRRDSVFTLGFGKNWRLLGAFVVALGLQAVAVYVPVLQSVFQTVPLSLRDVSVVLGLSMAVWLVGEAEKLLGKLSRGS